MLRRGMVIVDPSIEPKAKMFAAEVQILHHPGTIKINTTYCNTWYNLSSSKDSFYEYRSTTIR